MKVCCICFKVHKDSVEECLYCKKCFHNRVTYYRSSSPLKDKGQFRKDAVWQTFRNYHEMPSEYTERSWAEITETIPSKRKIIRKYQRSRVRRLLLHCQMI